MRLAVSRITWKARQSGVNIRLRKELGISCEISSKFMLSAEMNPHMRFGVDGPTMSTSVVWKVGTQKSRPKRQGLRFSKQQGSISIDGLNLMLRNHMEACSSVVLKRKSTYRTPPLRSDSLALLWRKGVQEGTFPRKAAFCRRKWKCDGEWTGSGEEGAGRRVRGGRGGGRRCGGGG